MVRAPAQLQFLEGLPKNFLWEQTPCERFPNSSALVFVLLQGVISGLVGGLPAGRYLTEIVPVLSGV